MGDDAKVPYPEDTGSYSLVLSEKSTWKDYLWDVFGGLMSRKLIATLGSIALIIDGVAKISQLHLPDMALTVALPFMITGAAVIVVTYLSGQAKIDVQANIQGPKV